MNYRSLLNEFEGSIQNKCVNTENVHVFGNECSHSSWTELSGEPGGLQKHEFEGILFGITQKFMLEHSEEIKNVNTIDSASPSWTRSVSSRSSDAVVKSKSACLLRFRPMCGTDE